MRNVGDTYTDADGEWVVTDVSREGVESSALVTPSAAFVASLPPEPEVVPSRLEVIEARLAALERGG